MDLSAARTSALPATEGPDAALWHAAVGGDDAAFERVVAAHESDVYRFVRSLGLDGADAEDALQETFIAAWRCATSFRGESTARLWLLGIARNVVRHARRRTFGEPADFEPLEAIALQAGWGATEADREHSEGRVTLVHDALAMLSDDDREILVLRELEGLSGLETAAALGLTLPAMKSRLQRARLRLTAALRTSVRTEQRS